MSASILVLCFFPAFNPPASGGELRLLHLYKALSKRHTVTLLTSTDFGARQEEIFHTPSFREIRFPKDELWREAYATLARNGINGELSGLAFALAVSDPDCRLRGTARSLAANADVIVHEFPFSEPIFADGAAADKEVYNAHNFELSLLGSIAGGPGFEAGFLKLMRLEGNLVARVRKVFATGPADAAKFRLFYGVDRDAIELCPSGYDETELAAVADLRAASADDERTRPQLLFFGSEHRPNVEAAHALLALAPALAHCDLLIAGGVAKALATGSMPANVFPMGSFDQAGKLKLLADADLFINPVVLGSGTSLKVLEALGAGLPVLSTPEGARGLDLVDGVHASIVPRAKFADAVHALIEDADARHDLAMAGQAFVRERFTWDRLAQTFGAAVTRSPPPRRRTPGKPLVLAFNDYPVLDTDSGGKARVFHLLDSLDASTVLLSFGAAADVVLLGPEFIHVTVPKTPEHQAFERAVNADQPLSVNDGVAALFAASNRVMTDVTAAFAARADACVFEHPYMAPMLDVVAAVKPTVPVVYSAHNVESTHRARMLEEHTCGDVIADFVGSLEALLVRRADLVVACTEADARVFADWGADTILAPNGCVVPGPDQTEPAPARAHSRRPRVGFMGSGHGPNVEAAAFIVRDLATALPKVDFELVGGVCSALGETVPSNVTLLGVLDEADKTRTLRNWTLALNPVVTGGGSSLKLPDFLAHGLPTISTEQGVRGFDVARHDAGVIVERSGFLAAIEHLLGNAERLRLLRANASRYANEVLSWAVCGRAYGQRLRTLIEQAPPFRVADRSLLVVTYRYTEPSAGGAEEYLIEVLKHLRRRFKRIDLAAVDVGAIGNNRHFATRLDANGGGAAGRLGELFDQAQFFTPDEPVAEDVARRCRQLERFWTRDEFELFLPFASALAATDRLRLFTGFYGAENHDGVLRRWTSPAFSLLVPPAARVLRLRGLTQRTKTVTLTLIRVTSDIVPEIVSERSVSVEPWFDLTLALPAILEGAAVILHFDVTEHVVDGDHRPFGLLVEEASVLLGGDAGRTEAEDMTLLRFTLADLAESLEADLRSNFFDAWVDALRESAARNPPEVEADFAMVRGPHSKAMQTWLAANGARYQVVLVQGIPFDVVPRTVETLARLPKRPRVVTLPHFHGDDRFYHWRRYHDAFARADTTLMFSRSVAERMALPGKLTIVPGGGLRPNEQADLGAKGAFEAVHRGSAPFFLVLGRKTASKGYERVLRAHAQLRAGRLYTADLVLVGPDEDGKPVTTPGAHYLGPLPRAAVRGALSCCLGLITMSTSESFGIVLCEAWLFGKPVIANRVCYSFRELVSDGDTGLLVSSDDELESAMARLAGEAELREALGRRGYEEAVSRFSWSRVADRIAASLDPHPNPSAERFDLPAQPF